MLTRIVIEDMGRGGPADRRWICEMHVIDGSYVHTPLVWGSDLPGVWKEVLKYYEKDQPKPALKAEAPVAVAPATRAATPPPLPARAVPRHPVSPAVTAPRRR